MAHSHMCSYCYRYAHHLHTGEPTGAHVFTGTRAEVIAHADIHPIGDPRDYPVVNTYTAN